jgi:hypothetical protein
MLPKAFDSSQRDNGQLLRSELVASLVEANLRARLALYILILDIHCPSQRASTTCDLKLHVCCMMTAVLACWSLLLNHGHISSLWSASVRPIRDSLSS